ncbi:MAG: 23S rRNA (guanosine(2251)-2'-O)-methyltransferase RlmB [Clostridiales bacterium]|jgi:23S rRNA (guanosine2251-2'-O)-methyltransferase|nr:23S rRNA (guanosine(2251)-2'-O)-methyltransferase RlmB [Clostridiales bacterium]
MSGNIEGRNPVIEAIKSGREIDKILIAGGAEGSIAKIKALARERGIPLLEVDRAKLNGMSETGAHQGVIAMAAARGYVSPDDILKRAEERGEPPFIIVLDEITDPHNLGSVLRTANAAGAHGVIIPKRRSAGLTEVAAKTSAGAVEYTPVARVSNLADTIDRLKKKNVWFYGASQNAEVCYTKADYRGAVGIVVGSEGGGMGRLIAEKCDFLVAIPMAGEINSLNASVAAGILMYEAVRQRRGSA